MKMSIIKQKVADLSQNPGVYFFRGLDGKILYIGKATNLRSRVSSYFRGANLEGLSPHKGGLVPDRLDVPGRSEWIGVMIGQVADIDFQETDSVLEALILESNLIKKHQPKYNTLEKDDKSFSYFVITKEEFPKIIIVRKTDLSDDGKEFISKKLVKLEKVRDSYGPYASKHQMQVALKIIRRIFPFHGGKQKTEKGCLDFQIGMCPGPYAGAISSEDYAKNIRGIKMILEGKKKRLVITLEKEMQSAAKKNEFEKAADLRNKIFALNHIRDVALMSREFDAIVTSNQQLVTSNKGEVTSYPPRLAETTAHRREAGQLPVTRIEAYDISNISGQYAVGSMVVFENGAPNKSQYRKFRIKTVEGSNDVAMMREVLLRRFKNDWAMPDLVLLDGGVGHVNMATKLLREELGLNLEIFGVAKGPTRKKLEIIKSKTSITENIQKILDDNNLVKSIMDEAHRFAITFHRKLRRKNVIK